MKKITTNLSPKEWSRSAKAVICAIFMLLPFISFAQNDDCANAIMLTPGNTCTNTAGSTAGATLSMAATPCFGNPDDDVWFAFVATATDAKIDLSGVSGSTDMYFQVLSGTCGSMTSLLCSDPNSGVVAGLTAGQTYYIRVYTYSTGNSATFNICVTNFTVAPTACGTLSTPAANAAVGANPLLTWSSATNATGYDIYLDGNNPPTTLAATVGNVTSYTVPSNLAVGDYYWYVVAKNSVGSATGCTGNARKFTVVAAPSNNECINAVSLTQGTTCTNTAGTTVGATLSMAATPCSGNPDDDVWYSFVATATDAKIDISGAVAVTGTSTDMYFQVLSGSCGSMTSLLCSDPNSGSVGGLTVGQTYYIRVYTYGAGNGATFNICVSSFTTSPSSCASLTTPAANGLTGALPILTWSSVTNATAYDIYLDGNNPPTTLAGTVYGNATTSYTVSPALATGNYYWYVVPRNSIGAPTGCASNARKFTVVLPPTNDDCANARILTHTFPAAAVTDSTYGATLSIAATPCNGNPDDDIWFSFVAQSTVANITISNVSSSTDMYHQLLSGSCGTLTSLKCSDADYSSTTGLTVGQTYYIRVYTYGSGNAKFNISVSTPVTNDECANAIQLPVNNNFSCGTITAGTTYGATASSTTPAPTCGTTGANDDVWFSFLATGTVHQVSLSNISGDVTDMAMAIYSGTCGSLTQIICSDPESTYLTGLTPGAAYYVRVYTYTATSTSFANFNICIGSPPPPPANDECANAVILTQGNTCTNTAGTTVSATQSMTATPCSGNPDDDVWYSFVATAADAKIDISGATAVIGTSTDMYFQVFSGACGSLNSLVCSDPNTNIAGGLTVGQTYYIRVFTYAAAAGANFNICVSSVTSAPTACATLGSPGANASVSATPTLTWTSSVTNASSYDIYLDGNNPPTTLLATVNGYTSASYTISTALPSGDYYWYVVPKNALGAATGCATNARKFTVIAPPANDEAIGAIPLVVGAGCTTTPYNNTYATQSSTEPFPSCKGSAGYAGMWYNFAAPASGAVRISNDFGGTLGDSRVALFSAANPSDYNTYNIVACDDDNGVTAGARSLFYATGLTPGAIYYVLVDLYASGTTRGTYCISVDELTSSMLATTGSCTADQASVAAYNANYTGWISLVDAAGKLNANVRQLAGTATGFKSSLTVNTAALRSDATGITYLNRNFLITGDNATSAELQLFYLNAELNTLNSVYGGGLTPASLNVSRVSGATCTPNYTGTATLLTQTASGSANGVNWVQVTTPGFSNFFIHPGNNPLPVQLEDITATNVGNKNRIDWNTSSETAGDYYTLERSADGRNYMELGTLSTKGQASTYSYWDQAPVNGVNYYRLKMVNAAGKTAYSKVVTATAKLIGTLTIEVYPNPVNDVLTVKTYGAQGNNPTITVRDITGKTVSTISCDGNDTKINMNSMPQGIYFIHYADDSNSQTLKVNKQ